MTLQPVDNARGLERSRPRTAAAPKVASAEATTEASAVAAAMPTAAEHLSNDHARDEVTRTGRHLLALLAPAVVIDIVLRTALRFLCRGNCLTRQIQGTTNITVTLLQRLRMQTLCILQRGTRRGTNQTTTR